MPWLLLLSAPLFARTIEVTDTDSLRAALVDAERGDTIKLNAGRYGPTSVPPGADVSITGSPDVVLAGLAVPEATTVALSSLQMSSGPRGLLVQGGAVTVEDVVFSDFRGENESFAIRAEANAQVTLRDVIVEGCSSVLGAVQVVGARLVLEDATLSTNHGPALFMSGGELIGTSVLFSDNQASHGGAVFLSGGSAVLTDALFFDNTAAQKGGAVYVSDGSLAVIDSEWSGSRADLGGHLYVAGGTVSLVRTQLLGASASFGGGGLAVEDGAVTVRNALWSDLSADRGGAVLVGGGQTDIRYSVFTRNDSAVGAAAALDAGRLSISHSIITGHVGAEAIANATAAPIRLTHSLLYDNDLGDWIGDLYIANLVEEQAPRFVNAATADYALLTGSPALDAGDEADLDGTPADMGLYGGPDAWPLSDDDDDGYVYGRDCDDRNAQINEAAADEWYDGTDANCDGRSDFDQDGDGFDSAVGGDCDDTDPTIHPGADDVIDGIDSNCDKFDLTDADGDGWPSDLDCNDADPTTAPGAEEIWYDGEDQNCMGDSDFDQDGDGHTIPQVGGDDCDDTDPFISPSAPEIRDDQVDQDCDGHDLTSDTPDEDTESNEIAGEDITPSAPEAPASAAAPLPSEAQVTIGCATAAPGASWAFLAGLLGLMVRRRR